VLTIAIAAAAVLSGTIVARAALTGTVLARAVLARAVLAWAVACRVVLAIGVSALAAVPGTVGGEVRRTVTRRTPLTWPSLPWAEGALARAIGGTLLGLVVLVVLTGAETIAGF